MNGPYFSYKSIDELGFTQYAAANDLIIIFPQARFSILNLWTCFDFTGYTGSDTYLTKDGVQMKAFSKMLDRVVEEREADYDYEAMNIYTHDGVWLIVTEVWRFIQAYPDWIFQWAFFFIWYPYKFILDIVVLFSQPTADTTSS